MDGALPWHQQTLRAFKNEVEVATVVRENAPTAGVYLLLPYHWEHPTPEQQTVPKGFMLFGTVRHESPDMPSYYLRGLGLSMLGALLITWLLLTIPEMGYGGRVRFVVLVALIAGVLVRLPDWNWWSFSISFTLMSCLDLVVGWFLAGLVIAKIAAHE